MNTILLIVVTILLIASLCLIIILLGKHRRLQEKYKKDTYWYINMLDSIPFPISVTDKNGNWTFINKPVEKMLNTTRKECIGKSCSNWGAKICKTENCGITCLKKGKLETFFEQGGGEFKVDTSYLHDENRNIVGHIEVVQDITQMVSATKKQERLIKDVNKLSEKLVDLAVQSADNARKLADGANDQTASVEELVATVTSMSSQTRENANRLKTTTDQTDHAAEEVRKGNEKMGDLISAMKKISETSQQISEIITTIENISSQTNLLALNASIEAARAGESGRGFSVVADQIGLLASQSAEAAKSTKDLIETTLKAIQNGNNITNSTAESLKTVVEIMSEVRNDSVKVSEAITKQAGIIEQVNQGLGQVAEVIEDNSLVARDSSETSQMLSEQSQSLRKIVNQ